MGYILPITHYTYKNYQSRMPKNDERPFHVGQKPPVFLKKLDEKVKEKRYFILLKSELTNEHEGKQNYVRKNNSEVTMKGKYVNEYV